MALDFPTSPTNGQTYNGYVYSTSVGAWQAKPAAQSPAYIGDTPPANPTKGDMWYNSADGTMYIYYVDIDSSQWTEYRSQIAKSQVGLVPITPTSVSLGSGTATVSTTGTVTLTNVGSFILNGVFTSAYRNYRMIVMVGSTITAEWIYGRMCLSGTSDSGYNYDQIGSGENVSNANPFKEQFQNENVGRIFTAGLYKSTWSIDIFDPQVALYTQINVNGGYINATNIEHSAHTMYHKVNSGYDGMQFISNGTLSGNIKIYGYN